MISDALRVVDTVPAASVLGDRGRRAAALGLRLTWTPCYYGGARPWLVCPSCGRRCARLHHVPGRLAEQEATCRRCLRLSYASKRLGWIARRLYRAERIREQLGGAPKAGGRLPARPRGMREATYARRRALVLRLEREAHEARQAQADRELMRWGARFVRDLARCVK